MPAATSATTPWAAPERLPLSSDTFGDRMKAAGASLLVLALLTAGPLGASAEELSSSERIVNGVPTPDFPSVAWFDLGGGSCTATFIGCRTALTAAHCVCSSGNPGAACPDGTTLANPFALSLFVPHAGFFSIESIAVRSGYAFGVERDVAVLEVDTPMLRGVRPAAINQNSALAFGTPATIVGFGITASLAETGGIKRVGAVSSESCAAGAGFESNHVCWTMTPPVGPPGDDSTICSGDSGGPLFADTGAGMTLSGVHSGHIGICGLNASSFGTDVFINNGWIESQAGADLSNTTCGEGPQVGDAEVTTVGEFGVVSSQAMHSFMVAADTKLLRVALMHEVGATQDYDLYVRAGSLPTPSNFDCGSATGFFEFCEVQDPAAGMWYALIDHFSGGAAEYQLTTTLLPENPAPPALADDDLLVADFFGDEVLQVDPATGDRAITSSSLRGSGARLSAPEDVIFDATNRVVIANRTDLSLLEIDPASGDRTVVSGCVDAFCTSQVGIGPPLVGPRLLAVERDHSLVMTDRDLANFAISAVVRIDRASGDRSVVSGCTDPTCSGVMGIGPAFVRALGIVVEPDGMLLVADTHALLRIHPVSGDREVLSGCANPACTTQEGTGPSFGEPVGLALEPGGDILVTDAANGATFRALFRVDPVSGERTLVSGCANAACNTLIGSGPNFTDQLFGIELTDAGELFVTDTEFRAVFLVDRGTGDRTVVSGCADLACASLVGGGVEFADSLGIASRRPDVDDDGPADAFDNCLYEPNPTQSDTGGLGAAPPDGIGDACQCGDPSDDGLVDAADVDEIRNSLTGASVLAEPAKCDVDDGACDLVDTVKIRRALALLAPGVQQTCAPANS